MSRVTPACLILLATLLLAACGVVVFRPAGTIEPLARFPEDSVIIETHGKRYPFKVWVADTAQRRSQGLMYVQQLDANQGMLFLFDRPTRAAMWMKNMAISIDLLFISAEGKIVTVMRNAKPDSTAAIHPDDEVTGVIELAGGTAKRLSLDQGDCIRHAHFVQVVQPVTPSTMIRPPLRTAKN